jgi:hypothetical protein
MLAPIERRPIAVCLKEKMFGKAWRVRPPAHAAQVAPAIEKVVQDLSTCKSGCSDLNARDRYFLIASGIVKTGMTGAGF